MTILNKSELAAQFLSLLPDNITQDISPVDVRTVFTDVVDSFDAYTVGMGISAPIAGIAVTATPVKFTSFDVFFGNDSPVFTPGTVPTQELTVDVICGAGVTLNLNGDWDNGDDLNVEIRAAGGTVQVPNVPIISQVGRGAGNSVDMHKEYNGFFSTNPPWSLPALPTDVEVWLSSNVPLTLNLARLDLAMSYNVLSIRAV